LYLSGNVAGPSVPRAVGTTPLEVRIPELVQSRTIVKVDPFCWKGLCSLLQPATSSTLIGSQLIAVEQTSALVVRLAAKVLLGKEDLPKSATAPFRNWADADLV